MSEKDTLYARWLSGKISTEELEQLQKSGELQDLEKIIKAADDFTLPSYDTKQGYEHFKNNRQKKPAKVRRMNPLWIVGIAASLLLLITAWFLFFNNTNQQIIAKNGMNQDFRFEDGSNIVLNDGSSIFYNKGNWQEQRAVELEGEALFHVQKGKPFIVNTPNGKIEVLGTSFNVRAWGSNLYVECYHGKVRVTSKNQSAILSQNQSVNVVDGQMKTEQNIKHEKPLWSTGNSRFYEEDIQEVLAEIERQFDVKVNFKIANRSFSGAFRHDDLESALNNICKPLGIDYTISTDKKTVTIGEKN